MAILVQLERTFSPFGESNMIDFGALRFRLPGMSAPEFIPVLVN